MSKVRDILGVDKESEFLQSFVRVGLTADQDDHEPHKSLYMQPKPHVTIAKQSSDNRSDLSDGKSPRRSRSSAPFDSGGQRGKRGRRRDYYEEMYTDKDRAAAVSYGYIFIFIFILISTVLAWADNTFFSSSMALLQGTLT